MTIESSFIKFLDDKFKDRSSYDEQLSSEIGFVPYQGVDLWYGLESLTEKLHKEKRCLELANIYEALGVMEKNLNVLKQEFNYPTNCIGIGTMNVSCFCYYAAGEEEIARQKAKVNYYLQLKQVEWNKKLISDGSKHYKCYLPFNIELLGDACIFFDQNLSNQYYAQTLELISEFRDCEEASEGNEYHRRIDDDLREVAKSCFNYEARFCSVITKDRIQDKKGLYKYITNDIA